MHDEHEPKTWVQRMAAELCAADTLTPGLVEAVLEAAGALEAARMKVLLARAFQIIAESIEADRAAYTGDTDDTLMDEIREALK